MASEYLGSLKSIPFSDNYSSMLKVINEKPVFI